MINFNDFTIYHLGISGGKDSTAALLWLYNESGLPHNRIRLTFCDTGNEDQLTYSFIELLSQQFPIETIYPDLDFWELSKKRNRFPSTKARFCTQHLKIIPSREYILNLMRAGNEVLLLSGLRWEEGHNNNDRGNLPPFEFDDSFACFKYYPILSWTLEQVWEIHKKYLNLADVIALIEKDSTLQYKTGLLASIKTHGIPRNPLYDMGARRVGCFPCINSSKYELRAMTKYRPERIEFIEQKEIEVGEKRGDNISTFFPRSYIPEHLRSKTIQSKEGETMQVPTIRDVAKWAQTSRGGKQLNFDFHAYNETGLACDIKGTCE